MANVAARRLFNNSNIIRIKYLEPQVVLSTVCINNSYILRANSQIQIRNAFTSIVSIKNSTYYDYTKKFSTSPKKDDEDQKKEDEEPEKLTLFQKFKRMYRDYWYVLVPVHLVTSAAWLGGFYYLAKSGVDVAALLESWNVSETIIKPFRNSQMGYFAVTYGLYKIATPARYAVTLGGTTVSINYLKKWGYIKPIPSRDRLREIYQERKDNIMETAKEKTKLYKEKKDNILGTVRETKENIKQKVTEKRRSD